MPAGLVTKRLTFRDVFSSNAAPLPANAFVYVLADRPIVHSLAAWQHWMAEAPVIASTFGFTPMDSGRWSRRLASAVNRKQEDRRDE